VIEYGIAFSEIHLFLENHNGNSTYVSLSIKKYKVFVVNLRAAILGDQMIKGFREKGE